MDYSNKNNKSTAFDNVGAIDLNKFAPLYSIPQKRSNGPEFIPYNNRGRDIGGRLSFNTGVLWLGGFVSGGAYGFWEGWRTAVNPSYRIRFNNVLNAVSKRGSALGSALGVIAFMHTTSIWVADNIDLEQRLGGHTIVTPAFAGIVTGGLYKSMRGPRAAGLAACIGGVMSCAYWYGSSYTYDVILGKKGKF